MPWKISQQKDFIQFLEDVPFSSPLLPIPPPPDAVFEIKNSLPAAPVYRHAFENSTTRENLGIDIPEDEVGGMLDREGGGARDWRSDWRAAALNYERGVGARRPNVIIPSLGETLEA